jgi:hypothetical protein
MSRALASAAPLKADIRLAQAVSLFKADLSAEQKATFRTYQSSSLKSPPNIDDVMLLTAEIDRHARKNGGGRCIGPRLTNVLQAVQQFASLGDVVVGGSQNMLACSVWSLVRMALLVSSSIFIPLVPTDICIVRRTFDFLPGQIVGSSHENWLYSSPVRENSLAVSPIDGSAIKPIGILHHSRSSLPPATEFVEENNLETASVISKRLRDGEIQIGS